jgi:hypothetical protein
VEKGLQFLQLFCDWGRQIKPIFVFPATHSLSKKRSKSLHPTVLLAVQSQMYCMNLGENKCVVTIFIVSGNSSRSHWNWFFW